MISQIPNCPFPASGSGCTDFMVFQGQVYCSIPSILVGATTPPVFNGPTGSPVPSTINASAPFVATYAFSDNTCSGNPTSIVLQELGVCEVTFFTSQKYTLVDDVLTMVVCVGQTCDGMPFYIYNNFNSFLYNYLFLFYILYSACLSIFNPSSLHIRLFCSFFLR